MTRFSFEVPLVFLTIAAIFGLSFSVLGKGGVQRSVYLFQSEIDDERQFVASLVELKSAAIQGFVEDYTFWDDMVEFVETGAVEGTPNFTLQNFDATIGVFGIDALWVFTRDRSLRYFVDREGKHEAYPLPVPEDRKGSFFDDWEKHRSVHFFVSRPDGIVEEFIGMTVHPTSDPERKRQPRGYLIVKRTLDANYVNDLARLSRANISLLPADASHLTNHVKDRGRGLVAFSYPLPSLEGVPGAALEVERETPIVREVTALLRKQALLYGVFVAVATVALLFVSLRATKRFSPPLA